jgi:hypothetical protein
MEGYCSTGQSPQLAVEPIKKKKNYSVERIMLPVSGNLKCHIFEGFLNNESEEF